MKKIYTASLILIIILSLPLNSLAQEFSLAISPQEYQIVSKKDQTITLPYTISNTGDPMVIQLKAYALFQKDSKGTFDIIPASELTSTKDVIFATDNPDITLEKPFLFQSNRTHSFALKITLPANVQEKDYYFMLVAESEEQKGFRTSSSILLNGAVGSVIYISVTENGALLREPQLALFDTKLQGILHLTIGPYTIVNSGQSIPLILSVVNGGKHLLTADGVILYNSLYNQQLSDTEIDKKVQALTQNKNLQKESEVYPLVKQTILANAQKTLTTSYDPLCESEDTSVCKTEHTVILPGHFIGGYRISPIITTDAVGKDKITSEKYIIFFPYYLFLFLGISVIIFSLLFGKEKKIRT